MKLKKVNAILSILSAVTLLIHVGYNTYAYFTQYYNSTLKILTAIPFIVVVCLHAVCGICTVFLHDDGTLLDTYKKHNKITLIQRISAALIFPLLLLHLRAYTFLDQCASAQNWFLFGAVIFSQIAFFAVIFMHVGVSFSKAFITLGILADRNKQKKMDRIVYILSAVIFLIATVAVVRGDLLMFLHV